MLHLFEPLGVGVGPSFLWAHTCMECWMYLNVFQIHIYAWNVECIWMCFEYTHMHGMLFECVWTHTYIHGIWFECIWLHTYAWNVVWMCLNTHIWKEYGLNVFEYNTYCTEYCFFQVIGHLHFLQSSCHIVRRCWSNHWPS
jgi:hypothetical protein